MSAEHTSLPLRILEEIMTVSALRHKLIRLRTLCNAFETKLAHSRAADTMLKYKQWRTTPKKTDSIAFIRMIGCSFAPLFGRASLVSGD